MQKLSVKGFAFALAITWGLSTLFLGWVAMFGWGYEAMDVVASFYIGYAPTFVGGIIGGIWGFIDGLIAGAVIAWLYNWIASSKKPARAKRAAPKAARKRVTKTRRKKR